MKATKQYNKKKSYATLIGFFAAFGGVGFFFFGLPHILPPAWMQAHDQQVAAHYHVRIQGVDVPANIGIDPSLWNDHSLDNYGIQGYAPIHTHDTSGIIHIETTEQGEYTMGDFLSIWGVKASFLCIVTDANHCNMIADPNDAVLSDGQTYKLTLAD